MDDTQQSRMSDAAATRKRRSSILKSQRPTRTPFSELEFNVATPTDTAKSRRVSFSRRTGVAEFITNEATTTWKNFYEEHNKSLESSGNDSDANASRQPVGHLGKRIFDQQFEEVEAVDFIGTLNPSVSSNGSLNNVNFTEQLASLECTSDGKLTAPQNKFELSAFTDQQSKIFGNDFTVQCVSEMSGRIDINFSAMQQVGNEQDDLDEIQRDIERVANLVCHGPFDRQNMSEYIEVDLNMTHVAVKSEEDMSITDTVHSPKVQEVSKTCSVDKKVSLSNDWVTDKENIAINPYAVPRESANFAINDEPDQVLVFDGKRLTLQSDKVETDKNKDYRQTLLPNSSAETPQRKTIFLNVNDDLPNFVDDMLNSKSEISGFSGVQDLKSNTMYNENDISMTLPVNRIDIAPKRKTIHDDTGNISMTQALPTNIISETTEISKQKSDLLRTIVYEEDTGNISVTQALPANIITNNAKMPERRRTVVYENDTGNISITQAVPTNILVNENPEGNEKRKTIVFDDDEGNISVTQVLSSNIILAEKGSEKRKTIVFDDDGGNISITQALPANIVLSDSQLQDKRRTIIYEDDTGNISVTQALPANVILSQKNEAVVERRRTVIYEDDTGNISVTQALPSNIIQETIESGGNKINDADSVPTTQTLSTNIILKDSDTNKRRTIVYEDDTGNISITQALPSQLIPGYTENNSNVTSNVVEESTQLNTTCTKKATGNKPMTIVYDNDEDISMTQAIPSNIILTDEGTTKKETIIFDNEDANISITRPIPTNVFLLEKLDSDIDRSIKIIEENRELIEKENEDITDEANEEVNEKIIDCHMYEQDAPMTDAPVVDTVPERHKKSVVFRTDDAEMSVTEVLPKVQNLIQEPEKEKSIIFDSDTGGNVSMTKPIPAELLAFQTDVLNKSMNKELDLLEQDQVANACADVIIYQATTTNSMPQLLSNRTEQGDLKSERPIDSNTTSEAKVTSSSKVTDEIISSPDSVKDIISVRTEDVASEDQSIIKRPPVEEKTEVFNLKPSNLTMDVDLKVPDVIVIKQETAEINDSPIIDNPKESVLNTLLDMSHISVESGTEDKNIMIQIESNHSTVNTEKQDTDAASSESMFYITKDSDDEAQTDKEVNTDLKKRLQSTETTRLVNKSPLSLEYKENDTPELVNDLQKKLAELKTVINEDKPSSINKFYDKIVNSNLEEIVEKDENDEIRQQSMNFRRANDTKELLDMISDFTDRKDDDDDDYGKGGNEKPPAIKVNGLKALENKSEVNEPRRFSFATNRHSIVLSREDLLNNISMAQAALQKSRLELDETDSIEEDTRDTSIDQSVLKKSARTSNEVVKTLHFDDESSSENSFKASPLKKTAFGETSYMTESKAKVIPTYLKDVSDGIKELMLDLVKPMADTMPFDAGGVDKGVRRIPSTQSTHVQANLITSSQIDIDCELYIPESSYDIDKMSSLTGAALNKSRSRSFRSPVKFSTNSSEKSSEFDVPSPRQRYMYSRVPAKPSSPPRVLVFDHLNPLNNILLGSIDYSEVHKYNPRRSDDTLCGSVPSRSAQIHFDTNTKDADYDMDHVSTQYRIEAQKQFSMQGDISRLKRDDEHSIMSNNSKPTSVDQSVDVKIMEFKDTEVNTLIAMKGNKELLEASSSLTLVDDAIGQQSSDIDTKSKTASAQDDEPNCGQRKVKISKSPVKVIYKIEELASATDNVESKVASNEDDSDTIKAYVKAKKRIYSPNKDNYIPAQPLDVTPKPNTKMQKISNSPNIYKVPKASEATKMTPEKDVSEIVDSSRTKVLEKKSPRKTKDKKPGTNITVQQLITEYHIEANIDKKMDKKILQALNSKSESSTEPVSPSELECNSIDVVSSFTSSNNLNTMKDALSTSTTQSQKTQQSQLSTIRSQPSRLDWHPELISGLSSKNLSDSDSAINVVAKIDMLPFMGSHECEWETSSGDTWTFRLLHGRLRLTARLAHRHENSTRTRVRGDTAVLDLAVETVQHDKKNPVATLCVRFACETMRYMVARVCRGTCYASDIPTLLRRCAAVARVALRWGRAMHDAKLHLAYTLDNDGYLTLKVANIPLRSVWEVRMRVELVVDDARDSPWPRAGAVRVSRVVSDVCVPEHDVRRALAHTPRDWGHAPRTIWRMFRYLKNKTRDDDLLLGA